MSSSGSGVVLFWDDTYIDNKQLHMVPLSINWLIQFEAMVPLPSNEPSDTWFARNGGLYKY